MAVRRKQKIPRRQIRLQAARLPDEFRDKN